MELNPADHGSWSVPAAQLTSTTWLTGPAYLYDSSRQVSEETPLDLIDPKSDTEIHSQVTALVTEVYEDQLKSKSQTVARFHHIAH